jgi:rhodanese-related sulfurtransferase
MSNLWRSKRSFGQCAVFHVKMEVWKKEILLRALRQSILILIVASAAGLLVNAMRPSALPVVADWSWEARFKSANGEGMVITLEEARKLCASQQAVFVDARSPEAYRDGHIICARNLPIEDVDKYMDKVLAGVSLEETIIVYCDGEDCSSSEDLAQELYFRGYDNAKVLVNGWARWLEAGLPTEQGEKGS